MRYPLCRAGLHPLNRANTYEHPQKGTECRECKREYMRGYMRERRAAMSARAAAPARRGKSSTARRRAASR